MIKLLRILKKIFGKLFLLSFNKILLPLARHLEEGRGTTIFELPRVENCTSRLCPSPLGRLPPKHPNRVKDT